MGLSLTSSLLLLLLLVSSCTALEELSYNEDATAGDELLVRVRRAPAPSSSPSTPTPSPNSPTPKAPTPTSPPIPTKIYKEKHNFYHATYINDKDLVANYRNVFNSLPRSYSKHVALSTAHRRALQIPLNFNFLFYGHNDIRKVTVATGGFLYLSDYLHRYITFSQYVAPLMADFDTSIGSGDISYADTGESFFARWEKVHIKNQPLLGNFTFETILHKNGTIIFVYEHIPVPLSKINTAGHSLKVGVSDAYYNDQDIPNSKYFTRRIIRYNVVSLEKRWIGSNTIIILTPLPTCVQQDTCSKCINSKTGFNCKWCSAVKRCSSGTDRLRQNWEKNSCHVIDNDKKCPAKRLSPAAVFLVVVILIILLASIIGLVAWLWYAYKHPTTRSGMFLMEHRPTVLRARFRNWRRGGSDQQASDIYRVDASANTA